MKFITHVWTHDIWNAICPEEKYQLIREGGVDPHKSELAGYVRDANSFLVEIMPGGATYQSATDLQKSAFDLMSATMREVGFPWSSADCTAIGNKHKVILLHELNHKAFLFWPEDNIWSLWGVRAWYKNYPPVYKMFEYKEVGEPGDNVFFYDWGC